MSVIFGCICTIQEKREGALFIKLQGRHNLKNSQGDSGGDVEKIFDI